MEKQHLRRFAYGFSALVLGLSVVGGFPMAGAKAIEASVSAGTSAVDAETPVAKSEALIAGSETSVVGAETPAVGSETLNVGADTPVKGSEALTMENPTLLAAPANDGGNNNESDGAWTMPKFENNIIVRAISTGEPFIFVAAPGAEPIVLDMTESTDDENEMMLRNAILVGDIDVLDNASGVSGYYGGRFAGFGGIRIADPEDISVEETNEGEYTVTATKAGIYAVSLSGYIADTNTYLTTTATLTAIDAETEAAKTIKDTLNANNKDGKAMWEASQAYFKTMFDFTLTAEEKEAAAEEYWQTVDDLNWNIERRNANTFGEDTEAIMAAVNSGKAITTSVSVTPLDETEVEDEVKDALLDKLDITFTGDVSYYDVKVVVYADGEEIGTLKELTGKQTVVIGGFEWAPSGYKRVFKVLAYHTRMDENGAMYTEVIEIDDVDFDATTGSISFDGDKFSTYMVAYKDVFAPSVDTGAATDTEGSSATANASVSVLVVMVIVLLASVVKFAKVRK